MNWTSGDLKILLPTFAVLILITLVLWLILKNKSEKVKNIPLATIAIIILVMEVWKQIDSFSEGYSLWSIPLHFCSLFLYFFPLATLTTGKVKRFGLVMSYVCGTLMTIMFCFNPSSIIGDCTFNNVFITFDKFHTFMYHQLVILFTLLGIFLGMFKVLKNELIYVVIGLVAYAIIAVPIAHLINTNFCNILTSNIGIMETLRVNAGQVVYTIVLFMFGIGAGISLCLINIGINKLIDKRRKI